MSKLNLANIVIVLVEPQTPGNIGSIARVMTNMGFDDLRIVKPQRDHLEEEARWMAHGAIKLLESSKVFETLEEAVADCTTLIATSHKPVRYKKPSYTSKTIAEPLSAMCINNKVAILFGRESHGLSNDEVKKCSWLLNVPAASEYPSLNISQAAVIICYELYMATVPQRLPTPKLVGQGEMEKFYEVILRFINNAGFRHKNNDPTIFMGALRRIFGRTGLSEHEIKVMHKLFSQLGKKNEQ